MKSGSAVTEHDFVQDSVAPQAQAALHHWTGAVNPLIRLRFAFLPWWLILWIVSVMVTSVMLDIVGWLLLSSSGVYNERSGWLRFHQVHPAVEAFSENGWSVRYILMDRWRRVWYAYWERRALARLTH